jgi:hypothetical protein
MLRIGIRAILEFRLMFRPLMRKIGRMAKVKSHAANNADITYVKAMMTSILMQVPVAPMVRVQKYGTGLHWKAVKRPNMTPARTLVNMTACMIHRNVRLVKDVMRSSDRPTESLAPIMVRQYAR